MVIPLFIAQDVKHLYSLKKKRKKKGGGELVITWSYVLSMVQVQLRTREKKGEGWEEYKKREEGTS